MGTGHCGSTLVELILASHPSVFGLGELKQPSWLPGEQLCTICEEACPFWDQKVSRSILRYYLNPPRDRLALYAHAVLRCLRSIYSYLFDWSDAEVLIDSSKSRQWFEKRLNYPHQWRNMQPMLLYIVRDGRAVVNSYFRKYPERGINAIIEDWVKRVESMNQYYEEFAYPKYMVHYEHMATDPESVTRELCDFVGVDFQPKMLNYWEHDHHTVGGNAGTRSLIFKHRQNTNRVGQALYAGEWHQGYYDHEPKIQLDTRWYDEMSAEHLALFQSLTGQLNAPFAYEVD